ncbi:hypothetical protein [Amazonocrinis nigriterrae]|nr:hypothetical protein [Amazonocrinis nigriterrae]
MPHAKAQRQGSALGGFADLKRLPRKEEVFLCVFVALWFIYIFR